ncbi:MAG: glycosyltransferase [Agathobacter sp.]|nr:glycosyltransferase [Agathobacter sp.]
MNDLITVMIPAYNAQKYIGRCIESLIEQTYKDIEILIVNDGSKDSTKSICEEYSKKDERVRLVNQENGGEGAARNTGLIEARGKYLTFVDADDYVKDDFIERLYTNLVKNDARLAICGFTELREDTVLNETSGEISIMNQETGMEMLLREDSFKGYVWNKIFDLDIIRQNKLSFDVSLAVWTDVLFVFQYMRHIDKIVFDPTPEYYYIYLETSVSHGGGNNVIAVDKSYSAIRAKEQMVDFIPENYLKVRRQLAIRFVQSSLAVLRNIGYSNNQGQYKQFKDNSILYIKKYYKSVKKYLSRKERILSRLAIYFPFLLIRIYKIVK